MLIVGRVSVGKLFGGACVQWSHGMLTVDDDLWVWNLDSGFGKRSHQSQPEFSFDRSTLSRNCLTVDFDDNPFVAQLLHPRRMHRREDKLGPLRINGYILPN